MEYQQEYDALFHLSEIKLHLPLTISVGKKMATHFRTLGGKLDPGRLTVWGTVLSVLRCTTRFFIWLLLHCKGQRQMIQSIISGPRVLERRSKRRCQVTLFVHGALEKGGRTAGLPERTKKESAPNAFITKRGCSNAQKC